MSDRSAEIPPAAEWLEAFRRVVDVQRELFSEVRGISARTVYDGIGEGGDKSLEIDRRAETAVFDELERLHAQGGSFTAISEERGEVVFGDPESPIRVVIDPIDGSLNARRTIPSHSLSIAVASGETMADVDLGLVHDFGADEEFWAERGRGARLDGEELLAHGPGYGLEVVGLEAARPARTIPLLEGLVDKAFRIRAIGSLAITLSYVGAGRLDGMLAARPCRSVDVAAAQLIAREAGANVKFGNLELAEAHLSLAARYEIVAGLDEEMLGTLLAVQRNAAVESS